jgi:hypothetical protein
MGSVPDVFVSYAHADAQAVAPLVGTLRERALDGLDRRPRDWVSERTPTLDARPLP